MAQRALCLELRPEWDSVNVSLGLPWTRNLLVSIIACFAAFIFMSKQRWSRISSLRLSLTPGKLLRAILTSGPTDCTLVLLFERVQRAVPLQKRAKCHNAPMQWQDHCNKFRRKSFFVCFDLQHHSGACKSHFAWITMRPAFSAWQLPTEVPRGFHHNWHMSDQMKIRANAHLLNYARDDLRTWAKIKIFMIWQAVGTFWWVKVLKI